MLGFRNQSCFPGCSQSEKSLILSLTRFHRTSPGRVTKLQVLPEKDQSRASIGYKGEIKLKFY